MSQEKGSYRQTIEKMETEIKDMEDAINGKKLGWFSTVSKLVKYPVAVWSAIFGGSIAASAIEMAGGGAINTTLALSSLSLPLGGVAVATIATGTLVVMTFNYFDRFRKKRANKEFDELSEKSANSRVSLLSNLSGGESIDFVFNQTSSLKPNVMSDDTSKVMIGVLKGKTNADFILNTINFSDVQLKDNVLKNLLSGGLGHFNSQQLVLRNNQLTDRAIHYLAKYIQKYNAFQTLRSLDLSGNKLTSECLRSIYEIASKLNIEVLDLSDNDFGNQASPQKEDENHLDKFLCHLNFLPFLKKISLRNIGLSYANKTALEILLTGLNAIESLDLRKNSALEYSFFQDHFVQGKRWLCHNLSLKELKTDHDAELLTNNILAKNDERFVQAGHQKEQSRLMFLLRSFVSKAKVPQQLTSTLQHFKMLKAAASVIGQNEALAKNDAHWLSVLKLTSEKMILDTPEEVEQEEVSPVLLNQFPKQTKTIVGFLLRGANGINLLFSEGIVLRHDSKTNAIERGSISDIVSIMRKENKNKHVLPDVDEDGNNIAIGLVDNKCILLKGDAQTNTWEKIDIRSLPQGTLEIRSKETHQPNQDLSSAQERKDATPRLAS